MQHPLSPSPISFSPGQVQGQGEERQGKEGAKEYGGKPPNSCCNSESSLPSPETTPVQKSEPHPRPRLAALPVLPPGKMSCLERSWIYTEVMSSELPEDSGKE